MFEEGVITEGDYDFFRKLIGFHDIVVHGYTSVDPAIIREILEHRKYRDVTLTAAKLVEWAVKRGV